MDAAPSSADLEPWVAHGYRVLVIEDEIRLARLVRETLRRVGYDVDLEHDGPNGLLAAKAGRYDVIVMDLMLPGMSGYDIIRRLRLVGVDSPVLVLTAKDGDYDQLDALELGADDYLTKPFSSLILVARLRKLIERRPAGQLQLTGRLRLEPLRQRAWLGGIELDLTGREYAVLGYLAGRPDQLVSKQELLDEVWREPYASVNLVEVCVAGLRRKIGPGVIETVRNGGYRVVVESA